jgi:hypothetical protein
MMPEIPLTALKELADSGAICEGCGGLHVAAIETAIIASTIATTTGAPIPRCGCRRCPVCRSFREAVERLALTDTQEDSNGTR